MGADAESSCTESRTDSWSPDGVRNPWSAPTTELWAPTRLDKLFDAHPRLKAGWQALQELHGLYLADDHQGALEALGRFCDLYETGELPEFHDTHTGGALSVGLGLTLSTTVPFGCLH